MRDEWKENSNEQALVCEDRKVFIDMGTKEKAAKQRGSEREAEKGKGKEGGEISEGRRARRGGRMQEREIRMQLGCRPEMKKK